MDRRQFLSALGVGMAALTARKVLAEPEPVRRYWQVPGNAPVGSIARENRLFCAVENGVQPLSVSAETFVGGNWEGLKSSALFGVDATPDLWSGYKLDPTNFTHENLREVMAEDARRQQRLYDAEHERLAECVLATLREREA